MEKAINEFLADKNIAIVGISAKKEKWGNELLRNFIKKEYSPIPVSNTVSEAEGIQCVKSISDLPDDVSHLIFAVSKSTSSALLDTIKPGRFKSIWFVYGSKSPEVLLKAESKGMETIYGYCPMMFIDGKGIHKFHYTLKKIFS